MVILVPGKGSTPSERLLAVGVRTLVWTFARMGPAVASQGAGVAKGLGTGLTMVWLLSSVDSLMHREGGSLNEHLAAVGEFADVRSDAGMDTFMASQVTASGKPLAAGAARIRLDRLRLLRVHHAIWGERSLKVRLWLRRRPVVVWYGSSPLWYLWQWDFPSSAGERFIIAGRPVDA